MILLGLVLRQQHNFPHTLYSSDPTGRGCPAALGLQKKNMLARPTRGGMRFGLEMSQLFSAYGEILRCVCGLDYLFRKFKLPSKEKSKDTSWNTGDIGVNSRCNLRLQQAYGWS